MSENSITKQVRSNRTDSKLKELIESIGKKIGNITVIRCAGISNDHKKHRMVECLCGCGTIFEAPFVYIKRKLRTSCGCRLSHRKAHFRGVGQVSGDYMGRLRRNAKKRSIPFSIEAKDIYNLFIQQKEKCKLSGEEIKLEITAENRSLQTASLDRIDSNKGYTIDNVQWVHKDVNNMKWNMDNSKFIHWCKTITEYQAKKNEIQQS